MIIKYIFNINYPLFTTLHNVLLHSIQVTNIEISFSEFMEMMTGD